MQDVAPVADLGHPPSTDASTSEGDDIARLCLDAYAKLPPKSGKPKQDPDQKCASHCLHTRWCTYVDDYGSCLSAADNGPS